MPFPSLNGTKQENLSSAWTQARTIAGAIKSKTLTISAHSQAGTLSALAILDYVTYLADAKLELTRIASLSGIAAFAQEQIGDPLLDIGVEYNALIATIDNTISWIVTNFPKDGDGYLQVYQFAVENNGRTTARVFTTEATAGLRTILDTIIVAID